MRERERERERARESERERERVCAAPPDSSGSRIPPLEVMYTTFKGCMAWAICFAATSVLTWRGVQIGFFRGVNSIFKRR